MTASAGTGTQTYLWYKNANISGGTFTSTGVTSQTYTVTSIGQYKVTVSNASGCTATSDATVISSIPSANSNGATTFCQGGSVAITTTMPTGASKIQWVNITSAGVSTPTTATNVGTPTTSTTDRKSTRLNSSHSSVSRMPSSA